MRVLLILVLLALVGVGIAAVWSGAGSETVAVGRESAAEEGAASTETAKLSAPTDAATREQAPSEEVRGAPAEIVEALEPGRFYVRAQLVDESEQPLAARAVELVVPAYGGPARSEGTTDAEGVVCIRAHSAKHDVLTGARVQLEVAGKDAPLPGPRAEATLPAPLEPGVVDLGTLVARAADVLVAGRVVDQRGTGIAEATVQMHELRRGEDGRVASTRRAWWIEPREVASGADGTFRWTQHLADLDGDRELAVHATHPRFLAGEPEPFEPGDEVALRLATAGWIEGRLEVAEDSAQAEFGITVEVHDVARIVPDQAWRRGADVASLAHEARLDAPGAFELGGLAAGVYELRLYAWDPFPAGVIENVAVSLGRGTTDTRLDPWTVTLRKLSLRIIDETGTPCLNAMLRRRPVGASAWPPEASANREGDNYVFRTTAAELEVRVEADGYRPLVTRISADESTLVLQRAGVVPVSVAPAVFDALEPEDELSVSLWEPGAETSWGRTVLTRSAPTANLPVPDFVDYSIVLGLRREMRPGEFRTVGLREGAAMPAVLSAAGGSLPTRLELAVDPEALAEALSRLER